MSAQDNSQHNENFKPERYDSWLSLELYIKANNPNLLKGLDKWLELDLIDRSQVIDLCRRNLTCTLPETEVIIADLERENVAENIVEPQLTKVAYKPSIISQVWQGFLDELSIRWLLFLGTFLVVVSSGVLAASQWQNFSRLGQYLILLVYTLAFWGIGYWSSKQNHLQLTAQTLSAIAILLVPINCWAISYFGLGNNILEWITLIISLVILTAIIYGQSKINPKYNRSFFNPLFLGLSYLHLGWQFIDYAPLIVYGSIIIVGAIHYLYLLTQPKYPLLNLLFLFSAWSLLLARALLVNTDYFADLSLAIAILGWIFATIYLAGEKQIKANQLEKNVTAAQLTDTFISKVCQVISVLLLVITWSISILAGIFADSLFFWQTVGISLLAIHLFSQRLTMDWRKRDLTAIFLIGLQTLYVAKELIPSSLRSNALDLAVNISQTEYLPESVLGVTLFPYVILFVAISSWLYRQQKVELASYAETLTMLLGIGLTILSLSNPAWRSLNFLFSTLTLGYVAYIRQPTRITLVYGTHLLGLITIINGVHVLIPNLPQPVWGSLLVGLMAGEWFIYQHQLKFNRIKSRNNFQSVLITSCWYVGLLLAAASYLCFVSYVGDRYGSNSRFITYVWGLIWLVTPGMLTWLAKHTRNIQQRRDRTTLSCIALIIIQGLVWGHPITRTISLSMAIALMFGNTFHLRRTWVAVIHLGFGLALILNILSNFINNENWLIVGAVIIPLLYQLRKYLKRLANTPKFDYVSQRTAHGILGVGRETRNFKLIRKYIQAADYWAIALVGIEVVTLSLIYTNLTSFNSYFAYITATAIVLIALIWRYRLQPNNLVLYTVAWLIELLAVGIVSLLGGNGFSFAVTNIVLGLIAWSLIAKYAFSKSSGVSLNLTYIPLIYAALGMFWRLDFYHTYTGIITLGAAFILINTPQPDRQLNLFTNYLGFAGISLGIYEIVIYQMQQSSGGSAADGLTILSLVAAAIAFSYRLGAWWYRQRQHTAIFGFSLSKIILVAHIHWAISSVFKIIAASIAIETTTPRLTPLSIATSLCLGAYAVIQGKDRDLDTTSDKVNDWWVYVGLVEIIATLVYSRLIINRLGFFDPWRIIFTCAIALLIYQIPWQNLGWRVTPWQRAAAISPALMALVTAEDISYLSLFATAAFYLRIAFYQKNIRWSYISLGFINWGIIRLVWQFNTEAIALAGIISLSILYIAQYDPYFKSQYTKRHWLRSIGCGVVCVVALFYQDPGIIPGAIAFSLIFLGLGLRIRALLFSGTITLVLTVLYQLITLVLAYSFLKWVVGLLAGIFSIIVAAGFEKNRDNLKTKFSNYTNKLQNWQ